MIADIGRPAARLYESVRPAGAAFFHELDEDAQRMWMKVAEKEGEVEVSLDREISESLKLREELNDTKHAVNEIKGKPPGWYHTMEVKFAADNFGFPDMPHKGLDWTASDGSEWIFQNITKYWDLVNYAPEPPWTINSQPWKSNMPPWIKWVDELTEDEIFQAFTLELERLTDTNLTCSDMARDLMQDFTIKPSSKRVRNILHDAQKLDNLARISIEVSADEWASMHPDDKKAAKERIIALQKAGEL